MVVVRLLSPSLPEERIAQMTEMARMTTVTQTYLVDGEVEKEQTFLITDMARIDGIGCPPVTINGFGRSTLEVRFTFDPPLIVPEDGGKSAGR